MQIQTISHFIHCVCVEDCLTETHLLFVYFLKPECSEAASGSCFNEATPEQTLLHVVILMMPGPRVLHTCPSVPDPTQNTNIDNPNTKKKMQRYVLQ